MVSAGISIAEAVAGVEATKTCMTKVAGHCAVYGKMVRVAL